MTSASYRAPWRVPRSVEAMAVVRPEDELLTVRQVAALVGRSPLTVGAWCSTGKLRSVKRGGVRFIAHRDVEIWLEARVKREERRAMFRQTPRPGAPGRDSDGMERLGA